jgi:hypothetical protein
MLQRAGKLTTVCLFDVSVGQAADYHAAGTHELRKHEDGAEAAKATL